MIFDDKPRRHGVTEELKCDSPAAADDEPQSHRDTENGKRETRQKEARAGCSAERAESAEHGTAMNGARRRAPPSDEESTRGSLR